MIFLFLFFMQLPYTTLSMELSLQYFKPKQHNSVINTIIQNGIYDTKKVGHNSPIAQVINITKNLNPQDDDQELYERLVKRALYFLGTRVAFRYMLELGLPDEILSIIENQMHEEVEVKPYPILKNRLPGHTSTIMGLALNNKNVYSASVDNGIKVWNVQTGIEQAWPNLPNQQPNGLALNPNGKDVCVAYYNGIIKVWQINPPQERFSLKSGSWWNVLAISPDGKTLYSGEGNGTIIKWNLNTGTKEAELTAHTKEITQLAISPDSKTLYSGSKDKTIKKWDAHTNKQEASFDCNIGEISSFVLNARDNTLYVAGESKAIKILDLATNSVQQSHFENPSWIKKLALNADSTLLYSASSTNAIQEWNLETQKEELSFKEDGFYKTFALSPDDKTVCSVSDNNAINVWQFSRNLPILSSSDWRLRIYKSFLLPHTPISSPLTDTFNTIVSWIQSKTND